MQTVSGLLAGLNFSVQGEAFLLLDCGIPWLPNLGDHSSHLMKLLKRHALATTGLETNWADFKCLPWDLNNEDPACELTVIINMLASR